MRVVAKKEQWTYESFKQRERRKKMLRYLHASGKAKEYYATQPVINCSMCEKRMSNKIANLQIENERPNAPICVPCILYKE